MKSSSQVSRSALLASILAVAGCANVPATKDGVVKSDDYEYTTPLGSNIPVLVKKGQKPATASPTATMSGADAANAIHSGGGQMTPPKGAGGP